MFHARWQEPVAEVLRTLGSLHVLVVHSEDGLDECSIAARTHVIEARPSGLREWLLDPREFGITLQSLDSLRVQSAAESLSLIQEAFARGVGPAADMIALNAGAALYAADVVESMHEGVQRARRHLRDGSARAKLDAFAARTRALAPTDKDPQ